MPATPSRVRSRTSARTESFRFSQTFADRTALAVAALVALATVSVVATTSAMSGHHAQERAVLTAR